MERFRGFVLLLKDECDIKDWNIWLPCIKHGLYSLYMLVY